MSAASFTCSQLEAAVLSSASTARWPDGSLLLDLDESVVRDVFMPQLLAALTGAGYPTVTAVELA